MQLLILTWEYPPIVEGGLARHVAGLSAALPSLLPSSINRISYCRPRVAQAAASGAGIKAVAVKPDDITLPQYMRRIGKVWAIRDGNAWIDVQHG